MNSAWAKRPAIDIPGESAGRYPSAPPKEGGVGYLAYCGTDMEVTPFRWPQSFPPSPTAARFTHCSIRAPRKNLPRSSL